MCPIFQGQANNDWKAIEVKQTDSIQLVIAVFASISTFEEVSRKTFFFFFLQGCLFSWLPFIHLVVALGHLGIWFDLLLGYANIFYFFLNCFGMFLFIN